MAAKASQNPPNSASRGAQTTAEGDAPPVRLWPLWARLAASVAIVLHLFAVFIPPLAQGITSPLVERISSSPWLRWYADPMFLNHGYHFFGPDPPKNRVVHYELLDEGGAVISAGEFPSLANEWPRLWYHRHMMLADQAGMAPEQVKLSLEAYARHLLARNDDAESAHLSYLLHNPLSPMAVQRGADPSEAGTYSLVTEIEVPRSSLEAPLPIPENAPPPQDTAMGGEP